TRGGQDPWRRNSLTDRNVLEQLKIHTLRHHQPQEMRRVALRRAYAHWFVRQATRNRPIGLPILVTGYGNRLDRDNSIASVRRCRLRETTELVQRESPQIRKTATTARAPPRQCTKKCPPPYPCIG